MKATRLFGFGFVVLAACSSESGTQSSDAGGTSSSGGWTNLGGASSTTSPSSGGSTVATGGAETVTGGAANGSGGVSSTGGTSTALGTGGSIASGGTISFGGTTGSGGLLGLGGTLGTGGTATGGAFMTGGNPPGGAPTTTGGTTATGGVATGGISMTASSATGGVPTNTGGTTATGGTRATGGTTATGGAATGGAATGGAATGGAATGGAATGGAATGGATTGGTTCTPVSASSIQFVDPTAGTDDDQHGSAFGACAYRTLTYALTRATGQIALQSGAYTSTPETCPIVLTGSQQLLCKYTTAASAVIQGKGTDNTGNATTIALRGTRNALDNCTIDGNGAAGYCVHITSSGSFSSSPHIINGSDIGDCGTAAIVIRYADNVAVKSSNIHNNQIGISWLGPNAGGSMLNNSFRSNSVNDIQCSIEDPGVTGSGNTALGVLYCSQCGNCSSF